MLSWRASGGSTPMRCTDGGIARTRSATAAASGEPSSPAISSTTRTASSWRVSWAVSAKSAWFISVTIVRTSIVTMTAERPPRQLPRMPAIFCSCGVLPMPLWSLPIHE